MRRSGVMVEAMLRACATLVGFWRTRDGAVTVDWVVLCAAATALALATMELGQSGLAEYSQNVRNEVQAPHFQTNWTH